jgi:hypothetical protein
MISLVKISQHRSSPGSRASDFLKNTDMKPNFLIIGAMKCATTSLCDILSQHPQIFVTEPKEPEFFCNEGAYARGWSWYESLFCGADSKIALGEGSTSYTKSSLHPHVAERIAAHLPDAKLIYIARHPLKRIESHWLHLIASGVDTPPLEHALKQWPHIIDTSLYWKQISAYRRFYCDERILVLFFEDFVRRPHDVMARCYEFLGVHPEANRADPSKPSHVSANVRIDGRSLQLAQKIPGTRLARHLAPRLAQKVMARLRRPLPSRPQWPAQLRQKAIGQLAEDSAQFLQFYGRPTDFWQWDEVGGH